MKTTIILILSLLLIVGCATQVEVPAQPEDLLVNEDVDMDDTMIDEEPVVESEEDTMADTEPKDLQETLTDTNGSEMVDEESEMIDSVDEIKADTHVITFEENFIVNPKELTIKVGETVTWVNKAAKFLHTPAWAHMDEKADSLKFEEEWSYTFTKPGEIKWFSTARPTAQGVIIVEE